MEIQVLRKMKYQNTYIYVMQFEYCFQYLFSTGSDIYQQHVFFLPPVWKRILYRLGLIKKLYSEQQLEEGEKIILSGAMESLDKLDDPKFRAERRKANKVAKEKNKSAGCVWQAREGKDDMYYMCLTHKQIVRMQDGVKPRHD